jgi:hypothetical protein
MSTITALDETSTTDLLDFFLSASIDPPDPKLCADNDRLLFDFGVNLATSPPEASALSSPAVPACFFAVFGVELANTGLSTATDSPTKLCLFTDFGVFPFVTAGLSTAEIGVAKSWTEDDRFLLDFGVAFETSTLDTTGLSKAIASPTKLCLFTDFGVFPFVTAGLSTAEIGVAKSWTEDDRFLLDFGVAFETSTLDTTGLPTAIASPTKLCLFTDFGVFPFVTAGLSTAEIGVAKSWTEDDRFLLDFGVAFETSTLDTTGLSKAIASPTKLCLFTDFGVFPFVTAGLSTAEIGVAKSWTEDDRFLLDFGVAFETSTVDTAGLPTAMASSPTELCLFTDFGVFPFVTAGLSTAEIGVAKSWTEDDRFLLDFGVAFETSTLDTTGLPTAMASPTKLCLFTDFGVFPFVTAGLSTAEIGVAKSWTEDDRFLLDFGVAFETSTLDTTGLSKAIASPTKLCLFTDFGVFPFITAGLSTAEIGVAKSWAEDDRFLLDFGVAFETSTVDTAGLPTAMASPTELCLFTDFGVFPFVTAGLSTAEIGVAKSWTEDDRFLLDFGVAFETSTLDTTGLPTAIASPTELCLFTDFGVFPFVTAGLSTAEIGVAKSLTEDDRFLLDFGVAFETSRLDTTGLSTAIDSPIKLCLFTDFGVFPFVTAGLSTAEIGVAKSLTEDDRFLLDFGVAFETSTLDTTGLSKAIDSPIKLCLFPDFGVFPFVTAGLSTTEIGVAKSWTEDDRFLLDFGVAFETSTVDTAGLPITMASPTELCLFTDFGVFPFVTAGLSTAEIGVAKSWTEDDRFLLDFGVAFETSTVDTAGLPITMASPTELCLFTDFGVFPFVTAGLSTAEIGVAKSWAEDDRFLLDFGVAFETSTLDTTGLSKAIASPTKLCLFTDFGVFPFVTAGLSTAEIGVAKSWTEDDRFLLDFGVAFETSTLDTTGLSKAIASPTKLCLFTDFGVFPFVTAGLSTAEIGVAKSLTEDDRFLLDFGVAFETSMLDTTGLSTAIDSPIKLCLFTDFGVFPFVTAGLSTAEIGVAKSLTEDDRFLLDFGVSFISMFVDTTGLLAATASSAELGLLADLGVFSLATAGLSTTGLDITSLCEVGVRFLVDFGVSLAITSAAELCLTADCGVFADDSTRTASDLRPFKTGLSEPTAEDTDARCGVCPRFTGVLGGSLSSNNSGLISGPNDTPRRLTLGPRSGSPERLTPRGNAYVSNGDVRAASALAIKSLTYFAELGVRFLDVEPAGLGVAFLAAIFKLALLSWTESWTSMLAVVSGPGDLETGFRPPGVNFGEFLGDFTAFGDWLRLPKVLPTSVTWLSDSTVWSDGTVDVTDSVAFSAADFCLTDGVAFLGVSLESLTLEVDCGWDGVCVLINEDSLIALAVCPLVFADCTALNGAAFLAGELVRKGTAFLEGVAVLAGEAVLLGVKVLALNPTDELDWLFSLVTRPCPTLWIALAAFGVLALATAPASVATVRVGVTGLEDTEVLEGVADLAGVTGLDGTPEVTKVFILLRYLQKC